MSAFEAAIHQGQSRPVIAPDYVKHHMYSYRIEGRTGWFFNRTFVGVILCDGHPIREFENMTTDEIHEIVDLMNVAYDDGHCTGIIWERMKHGSTQ